MDIQQRGIITLIRSGLTGERLSLPEGFDLEAAWPQLVRYGVVSLAYDGALKCGVDKHVPVMQKMFQGYLKYLLHGEGQLKMLERVCTALEENGFDHLLLKGALVKKIYPKQELRQMGDADILIRKEQYEAICPVMEQLGFRNTAQGFYDYGWKSPELYVELHHCLSNPYNTDFNDYLGDGWPRARKSNLGKHRFEYSVEDHFVYLFVHFTKHYRDGGIGLRHAADLWVYRRAYPDMDTEYVTKELEKMGLHIFYANVTRMLSVWFEDAPKDDVTEFITKTIFSNGAFGAGEVIEKAVALRAANKMGAENRAKYLRAFKFLFPTRTEMQRRYPVLKRHAWLLPFIWPVRWGSGLLFRQENVRKQWGILQNTSGDTIRDYRKSLEYVGLNYTIKD